MMSVLLSETPKTVPNIWRVHLRGVMPGREVEPTRSAIVRQYDQLLPFRLAS